jgi:hypothetical protein
VSAERSKAEARLQSLSSRRWPVVIALASAVVLSLLLGLYMGWRQAEAPTQAATPGAPLKLKLEQRLGLRGQSPN